MLRSSPPSEPDQGRIPKACVPCARAKVRCEAESGEEICKRCRRLKKACKTQVPGAHKRQRTRASDVKRLEQKLDGVAAILAASERIEVGRDSESRAILHNSALPAQSESLSPSVCVGNFLKSDEEGQLILNVFRDDMASYFPFVIVPPTTDAKELRQKKPFLFMAVMTVGCGHDAVRQISMAKKHREVFSYNMLVKGELSLDLLQGLLVYLAWYHLQLPGRSQLNNLFHLMTAAMIELNLNKLPNTRNISKPTLGSLRYFEDDRIGSSTRSLEQRRTFLGCFYLSSMISICARDIYPIKYSAYADECCRTLAEASEYPTDGYLVQLVRLHRLAYKISRTLDSDDFDFASGISAPIGACVKSMENELLTVKNSLPLDSPHGALLLIHYHTIELSLYEVALNEDVKSVRYGNYPISRLNMLFACLNSTKSSFDTFESLPHQMYFSLPYTVWTQLGHAAVVLSKLSLFSGEGWDQSYVQSTLNFGVRLESLARRLEQAKVIVESSNQHTKDGAIHRGIPQIFSTLRPRVQKMKEAQEMRQAAQSNNLQPCQAPLLGESASDSATAYDELDAPDSLAFFEFLDDSLWQHFS